MKQRILTALVILAVSVPILIFSQYVIYPIALALLALGGMYEMFRAIGVKEALLLTVPAYAIAFAMPIGAFFWMRHNEVYGYLLLLGLVLFLYLIYQFLVAVLAQGRLRFADVGMTFASTVYLVLSFTSLSLLRYLPKGEYLFGLVFIGAWICDVFAYFVGTFFGKHKLIPKISPKKSVEGAIGGVVFDVIAFLLYGFLIGRFTPHVPNYLVLAVAGFSLAVVSQIGDLVASLIKREFNIKDYGTIFPGHGGIMDRFDSILATSTVLAIICFLMPPIA